MSLSETLYEAVYATARPLANVAAVFGGRARRAVVGRRESMRRCEEWAASDRDRSRPLVWFHAPSVGEGLMAQAIIAALREARPDVQVAFTHFSPSAERIEGRAGADVSGYLPWDTRGVVRKTLDLLEPSVVVFVRTEVWPVVTREARQRGCRLLLVNAVLSEDSGRLSRVGRAFLESVYRRLDAVGAVSPDHARRYELLGVPPASIRVTGDARFDQVWRRVEERGLTGYREDPSTVGSLPGDVARLFRALRDPDRFTLVAGSTWGSDEKVLLPALAVLRRDRPVLAVVAPHDPSPGHLESLERRLDRHALPHARLGALLAAGGPVPDVVVVDRLGVLADLYALAQAAYVGGGFRSAGLHSVVEPAALGVPVLFGPRHGNAREAGELVEAGGGLVVETPRDVESQVRRFLDVEGTAESAGQSAREYVRSQTGAAERNARLVEEHVDSGASGTKPGPTGIEDAK